MSWLRWVDERAAWVLGPVMLAMIGWAALTLPLPAVVILGGAAAGSFAAWYRTGYRRPISSRRVVAVYLAAVAFQIIHLAEEWHRGFPHELVVLFGSPRPWSIDSFLAVFVFGFGALWVGAAAGALYGFRIAGFFMWFYALGAGLINAISHLVFPVIKGGYFPGLLTAPGHLILSVLLLRLLISEDRQLRAEHGHLVGRLSYTDEVSKVR